MTSLELEKESQELAKELMKKPHYSKMGLEAICIIVDRCRTMGIDPLIGLNGGMHNIQGKIEMSANLMNTLIRQAKHSITKDRKSDNTICILHGKRADNGDTWTESYSLEDAKTANLLTKKVWKEHPRSMLFARALSLLARQLFPDVIHGCYVEGEISESIPQKQIENKPIEIKPIENVQIEPVEDRFIDSDEIVHLESKLAIHTDLRADFLRWCEQKQMSIADVKLSQYNRMINAISRKESQGESE